MSDNQELVARNPYDIIDRAKKQFMSIAAMETTGISYEKESVFAYQALTKTDFAMGVAMKNPVSVVNAVVNIASVGLSLNPATSYAYLVPRDGAICLDISYQGLIKIATDSGSIMWAKADLVYSEDTFKYHGPAAMPEHTADPFGERGDFTGVYCIAKTCDGDYLVETIKADEVLRIMNESASIKHAKTDYARGLSPWTRYFGEMTKKTCIKRASKTWPKTQQHERIQKAIEVIHETEGSDWEPFTQEERDEVLMWIDQEDGANLLLFGQDEMDKSIAIAKAITAGIPRGGKGKHGDKVDAILAKTNSMLTDCYDAVTEALGEDNAERVKEIYTDLDETEITLLNRRFTALESEQVVQTIEEMRNV
jgi:recombination protein RecT